MFSTDLRAKAEAIVDRFPVKRSALLPLLHLVQYQDGYVSDDGIVECAELLDLTKAEVAAVSTFYTMYKRQEMGQHLVSVCTNFSCAVRGGKETFDALKDHLGVGHDQTTGDGMFTLEHAECLGNCEGAPVVTVDYMNYEWLDGEAAVGLVESIRAGEMPPPTRGMIPPGVRAASHRLSGIGPVDPDGPGQRLGLATKEDGAVPAPDSGIGSGGFGVLAFTSSSASANGASGSEVPDEVPPPDHDAGAITEPATDGPDGDGDAEEAAEQAAAAEGVDAEEIAEEAAPSDGDPALQGAKGADDQPGAKGADDQPGAKGADDSPSDTERDA